MYSDIIILFLSALLAGAAVFFLPSLDSGKFKMVLSFSGAYLFSITVIHILPELYHQAPDIVLAGIYVLIGFFLQMIQEYFSSGVEHGHIHLNHDYKTAIPYSVVGSLFLHSILEGTLLVHPAHTHAHNNSDTLLYGLVLHKIPEAIALMSVVISRVKKKSIAVVLLLFFSLASPLGLMLSNVIYSSTYIDSDIFMFLFAIVAGNFLYISTTIFFETSANHKFKANKLAVSLLGAAMAIAAEFFFKD